MADSEMTDAASPLPIKPIVLPSRPTCLRCIAWSEDLIAVAGGEVVHIINTAGPAPHLESVRVNEFEETDARVEMANQVDFSIGREQSNSSIVALSWSSPGLGIHKRPILAILTANHLLSFWEFTGKSGTWRRTVIINPTLIASNSDATRKAGTIINAFVFLPPFVSKDDRAKDHFLAVLDNEGYVWVISVAKTDATSEATWEIKIMLQQQFTPSIQDQAQHRSVMRRGRSVYDVIEIGSVKALYDENGAMSMSRTRLHFRTTGHRPHPSGVPSFLLEIEKENGQYAVRGREADPDQLEPSRITPEAFGDVIADAAAPFDKEYSLDGHYAIRWRGFAESPDGSMLAACITLHPSAGPESLQPRSEQSIMLFAATEKVPDTNAELTRSDALRSVLQSIMRLEESNQSTSDTDALIVRTAVSAVRSLFTTDVSLMRWAQSISDRDGLSDDSKLLETCEICQSESIPFADGIGICDSGHRFTRCGILQLSVQSPGLSKYCSKCSKSFLRIEKLEHQNGPSLAKSLLEEWDLCPYCQGFYRD